MDFSFQVKGRRLRLREYTSWFSVFGSRSVWGLVMRFERESYSYMIYYFGEFDTMEFADSLTGLLSLERGGTFGERSEFGIINIYNNAYLEIRKIARNLRRNMNVSEKILWWELGNRKLNSKKFNR